MSGKVSRMPRAEQWAERICQQLQKSVESVIETGRLLNKAKADLAHGEWGRMFEDGMVPFTPRTAQRLMEIATHPVISNTTHASYLPASWMTLYELTKVPEPTLKSAIRDKLITPDMPRKAVSALLRPSPTPAVEPFHSMNAVADLRTLIERAIAKWPDEVRAHVPRILRELADELEGIDVGGREGANSTSSGVDSTEPLYVSAAER